MRRTERRSRLGNDAKTLRAPLCRWGREEDTIVGGNSDWSPDSGVRKRLDEDPKTRKRIEGDRPGGRHVISRSVDAACGR